MGELHIVRCDGGRIRPQGAHGAITWHMRPLDKGGQQVRGREDHLCGVLPQGVPDGKV